MDQLPLQSFPCAKLKLDQFFLQWLADHQDVVTSLLEDVQAGRPLRGPVAPSGPSPLSPSTAHAIFASTPPLSPSKPRSPRSPLSPQRKSITASSLKRPPLAALPQFYFPSSNAPVPESARDEFSRRVDKAYEAHPQGLPQKPFVDMAHEVCDLATMIGYTLFRRLAGSDSGVVPKDVFYKFWLSRNLLTAPRVKQVFEVLRRERQQYLVYNDFSPLMECILQYHPGLEFLHETAEFQKKYAETVILRIFYTLNRSGSGQLTLREMRRGEFIEALDLLDKEDDINKVLKFFSYEHFYVIYCKFWELDTDHDFLLDKSDLAHYGQCALSYLIIDRIFEEVPRRFSSKQPGKMGYEDFVWFILSEEDKTTDTAMEYWFKCVDLDCDGVVRPREMWYFYEEQLKRLENLSQEPVLFEDMVCQLHDMLQPEVEGAYTIRDLKRTKPQSALFFNALFNLHKFLSFENRDPFAMRAEAGEFAGLTDWEKYAKIEYYRLAAEDDQEEVQMEADEGVWPDVDTAMMDALDRK
eukprot:CAMPEP_0202899244 /NCGR_PEP_ID=MMETSP1392-20130828/7527_1 /ASSEMBLY_ACC=CAM_ASM_000868 /TAXON_ID=225041 /ORGANISM="Chlamydomonas chlamydogama, Strain SAG 11-48b" /LENGTH=523 /DNA_ID=CAMNT_0049585371 /DNA_START=241 /DNA_END=1812 /DNA_ORIENTATION=-